MDLKNYKISRKICRKLCFTVYDATNKLDNQRRFLKVLSDALSSCESAGVHFLNTARMAGYLKSERVCKVYRYGIENGRYIIESEPVDLKALSLHIHEEFPFPITKIVDLLTGIANVLREAHLAGIVHGLLNPGSIFVAEGDKVKLDDFCYHWIPAHLAKLDESEVIFLSNFIAPEFFQDKTRIDGRADIYSLGAILLQLLTGEVSLNGSNTPAKSSSVSASIGRLRQLYPENFEDLEKILKLCLSKEPENRYFNLSEFVRDLKYLSSQESSNSEGMPQEEMVHSKR